MGLTGRHHAAQKVGERASPSRMTALLAARMAAGLKATANLQALPKITGRTR
jgi:hypothetical protein